MELAAFRKSRDLTLDAFAAAVGIKSKGYISRIESGLDPAGLRLAIRIQRFSEGAVPAIDLVTPEDRELLEYFRTAPAVAA